MDAMHIFESLNSRQDNKVLHKAGKYHKNMPVVHKSIGNRGRSGPFRSVVQCFNDADSTYKGRHVVMPLSKSSMRSSYCE